MTTTTSLLAASGEDSFLPARGASIRLPRFQRLILLLPIAYAIHILEEYLGGFPRWVDQDVHGSFDDLGFALNNLGFMAVLLALVTINSRRDLPIARVAFAVFASANLFWDALFHLTTTALLDRYSPGLVSAMLLYLPLSLLTGLVVVRERILSVRRFAGALTAGLALFAFIVWFGLFHFAL